MRWDYVLMFVSGAVWALPAFYWGQVSGLNQARKIYREVFDSTKRTTYL